MLMWDSWWETRYIIQYLSHTPSYTLALHNLKSTLCALVQKLCISNLQHFQFFSHYFQLFYLQHSFWWHTVAYFVLKVPLNPNQSIVHLCASVTLTFDYVAVCRTQCGNHLVMHTTFCWSSVTCCASTPTNRNLLLLTNGQTPKFCDEHEGSHASLEHIAGYKF